MSGPPGPGPVGVILAVDPARFAEVVEALQQAGLAVTAQQRTIGTLSGTVPADLIPALKAVDGVATVEQEGGFLIPPPESPAG